MNSKKIFTFILLLICVEISSQTGPGGVGTNDGTSDLIIWYRPDNGISTTSSLVDSWSNSAGVAAFNISETGSQRPTLVATAINGYDEVSFNGSNRLRTGLTLNSSNFIINQATSFIVTKADNITQSSSVYTTDPLVGSTRFSNHIPWSGTVYYDIGSCCGTASRIQVGGLTNLTAYSIFTYNANPSNGKQLYRNQTLLQNRANTSTYTSYASQRFNLGANTSGTSGFQGDVTELVIYKTTRNNAERIIVDNYLAAKFNQSLNTNDFYNQDDSGSGNFDHNVAGIGQATDASNHTDSQGTGIIKINNPTDLQNDEYLFWGENIKNANYDFSEITSGNIKYRLNTTWRTSKVGDLGNVDFSVNSADLDFTGIPSTTLKLIRSTTSDFSTIDQEYNLTLSDGIYSSTVSLNNNDYFTLQIVPTVDLSLIKLVNKPVVKKGDTVTFTISVTNSGNNAATGVQVKDILPTGLLYDATNSTIPVGTTYNSSTGIWDFSNTSITNGETVTLTLSTTAQSIITSLVTNTSEIIAVDQEDIDSIPNNGN
jgi:uncharacterized repeat protein (TIGR01451 family)